MSDKNCFALSAERKWLDVSTCTCKRYHQENIYNSVSLYSSLNANCITIIFLVGLVPYGFMRIIGPGMLNHFEGRIINLHPSLLPLYRGTDTYQRALDAGDSEHGSSIHFVTEELDGGPVISQVRIPIYDDDDKDRLAARLAPMEHRLLVATVELSIEREVECRDGSVFVDGEKLSKPLLLQRDETLS